MHNILFTGHMIDAAGRKVPRFAAGLEPKVRAAVYQLLEACIKNINGQIKGIAAAACGADILFHECCIALNMASEIFLALPPEDFKKASVAFAGSEWIARYDHLLQTLPTHILQVSDAEESESVWERSNTWMLQNALANGGSNMTLIAVWDCNAGDGKGGTQHMIEIAKSNNADVRLIDINML